MARLSGDQVGARVGALVGAVGGLLFVVVNAGAADRPWALLLRIAGVVLFVGTVLAVLRAPRLGAGTERTPEQMRAYWWIVLAEVVAIVVGTNLLVRVLGIEDAGLPWVVTVVGAHFVGFARIFPGAGFLLLGAVVTVLGLVGLVLAVAEAGTDPIALLSGVLAGFVLLAAVLRGVWLGRVVPSAP